MDMFFDEYCQEPTNGLINKDLINFHVVMQEERIIASTLLLDKVKSLEDFEHQKQK